MQRNLDWLIFLGDCDVTSGFGSPGRHEPNVSLTFFLIAELFHNFSVAVATVFPLQPSIHIAANKIFVKYELKILSYS